MMQLHTMRQFLFTLPHYRPVCLQVLTGRSVLACQKIVTTPPEVNQQQHRNVSSSPRFDGKSSFYITTPIFYVNSVPHLGHLHTVVLADAFARWLRMCGKEVRFSVGTDEHGLKIQQSASKVDMEPFKFSSGISEKFKGLFNAADISHTDFIRTTDERHKQAVLHFWELLLQRGFIKPGVYEGWYSTSDEAFLTNSQVEEVKRSDGQTVKVSIESGHPVEWVKEENYMFTLSEFGPELLKWLDRKVVRPQKFEDLVRHWIAEGLPDLSVSRQRSRLQWGIPVPEDDNQTIYVWLDALVNYLTVAGYPHSTSHWPADCHVIGKDILRFHAIYWPAFLLAAGMELPKQILCHSHWLHEGVKMSKSLGNVVDPFDRMEKYTVDGLRFYLLKESVPHSDGNYSERAVMDCINSALSNTLGNLLSRATAASVNPQQVIPQFDPDLFDQRASMDDKAMLRSLHDLPGIVGEEYESFHFYKGLDAILSQLHQTNTFVQYHKPWELCKNAAEQAWLDSVLAVTLETLRICGLLLQPVTPTIADKLLKRLNVSQHRRNCTNLKMSLEYSTRQSLGEIDGVLFPRKKV